MLESLRIRQARDSTLTSATFGTTAISGAPPRGGERTIARTNKEAEPYSPLLSGAVTHRLAETVTTLMARVKGRLQSQILMRVITQEPMQHYL